MLLNINKPFTTKQLNRQKLINFSTFTMGFFIFFYAIESIPIFQVLIVSIIASFLFQFIIHFTCFDQVDHAKYAILNIHLNNHQKIKNYISKLNSMNDRELLSIEYELLINYAENIEKEFEYKKLKKI